MVGFVFIPKEIQKGADKYAKDRYVYPSDDFWTTLKFWRNGVKDVHDMRPSKLRVGKNDGEEKIHRRGL
tara:strand:+ start:2150 stop:2356 length:207 start_codon:yes stop_codon:yes gene_type:complete